MLRAKIQPDVISTEEESETHGEERWIFFSSLEREDTKKRSIRNTDTMFLDIRSGGREWMPL